MANDRNTDQLIKAVDKLINVLERKNAMSGRDSKATRLGRGGQANARKIINQADDLDALIDSFDDLHKSVSLGGRTLKDHFKSLTGSLNPLEMAFDKLEEVIQKNAYSQSRAQTEYARATKEYIKSQKGNMEDVKELNRVYAEYVATVNELAAVQKSKKRDEDAIKAALKKEAQLRDKLNNSKVFKGDVASENLKKYFTFLEKNTKLGSDALEGLGIELDELKGKFKAVNDVSTEYVRTLQQINEKAAEDLKNSLHKFTTTLGNAIVADAKKLPNFIQSRLQAGFESNEFIQAFRLGVSPDELNKFRANNREVLNSLSNFGQEADKVSDGTFRELANSAKQVGLTGQEALNFVQGFARQAYTTGRKLDSELNASFTNQAMVIQQAFGGTIDEAAAKIQDYTSQVYNIQRYNAAANAQEQMALDKELKTRALLTKYMGYDIEYMKQQDALRHNAQFGDIADRIRGAVMGEVSAQTLQTSLGLTEEERAVYAKSRRPGAKLTNEESATLLQVNSKISQYKQGYEKQASDATTTSEFIGALTPHIVEERAIQQSGGDTLQGIVDNDIRAQAQRNARGDISFEDYQQVLEDNAVKQANSVSLFDKAVMEFAESARGIGSIPGAGIVGAIGGFAGTVLGQLAARKIIGKTISAIRGKGGGLPKGGPPPVPPTGGGGAGGAAGATGAANAANAAGKGGGKGGGILSKVRGGKGRAGLIAAGLGILGFGAIGGASASESPGEPVATPTPDNTSAPPESKEGEESAIGTIGRLIGFGAVGTMIASRFLPKSAPAAAGAAEAVTKTAATDAVKTGVRIGEEAGLKGAGKIAAKGGGKALAKKVPILGLIAGLGFAASRISDGDALGAAGEVASGAASLIPVLGTAASIAIDAGLIGRDVAKANLSEDDGKLLDKVITAFVAPSALLGQLAAEKIMAPNTTESVASGLDAVNGVKRDENGQVIPPSPNTPSESISLLQEMVNLLRSQTGIMEDDQQLAKDAVTQTAVANATKQTTQEHLNNMANSINSMFTVGA